MRNYLCYQKDERSCGYASVKTLAAFLFKNGDYRFAPEPNANITPSLKEVVDYANSLGIELLGYASNTLEIGIEECNLPLLAGIKRTKGSGLHLVAILKKTIRGYLVLDPDKGEFYLSQNDLKSIYGGFFLSVRSYKKKASVLNCPKRKNAAPLPPLGIILGISPMLLLGTGFVFLSFGFHFGYILACFILYAVSLVAQRSYLLKAIERFDEAYEGMMLQSAQRNLERRYECYQTTKATLLTGFSMAASMIIQILLIVVFFSLSNYFLSFCFATIFILRFIEYAFRDSKKRHDALLLEANEKEFLLGKYNEEERKRLWRKLKEETGIFGKRESYRACLYDLICLCLGLLASFFYGQTNISSFLFCFFAVSMFKHQLDEIFGYISKTSNSKKARMLFQFELIRMQGD